MMHRRGFSLVELSIVLVILGLLTGGILAGQSLIRASELRAVTTEVARYTTAAQTFRDKYFSLPGDTRDATRFWLRMTNTADCVTNSSAAVNAAGSCDGDGDGMVEVAGAASQSGEMHQYWRQLALSGLIEGTYTGTATATSASHVSVGSNAPRSKLGQAGWGVVWYGTTSDAARFTSNYGNVYTFGATSGTSENDGVVLKAEEMWNIDTKMDDGRPAYGTVISRKNASRPNCATTDVESTAQYALTTTAIGCNAYIKTGF
ncbi:MAG: prepilin-type N-terminal cleavage/methylation domain-containing protein [Alphaproteobacteria bacterium]|nr:prepilin-type N-terminal cleavage/methylation domain-containing protein [Alphaproteobacteria bacterium]